MKYDRVGVILNGESDVISVVKYNKQPMFYYLKYFRCTKRPELFNILITKNYSVNNFRCFRCGRNHKVRNAEHLFEGMFEYVGLAMYNVEAYGVRLLPNRINIIKAMLLNVRQGDFIIV